jgi:hypothetical protein
LHTTHAQKSALRIFKLHTEEEYVVNPKEMSSFSENSYVFVVLEFREMGLWCGLTLVYPVFTYGRNLGKERKQIPEILILKRGCLWHFSPRGWGYMLHP